MCHSDTLLHQKNVRFFCFYSSETGMHATSRNSVKSPKMMQGFFDVSSGQTIFHAAKKDSWSSFRHSFQLGLQWKFSAKVTSTKHLTESPLPPQCGSSCLVSWLLNSKSLVLWGIEKYNNTITSLVCALSKFISEVRVRRSTGKMSLGNCKGYDWDQSPSEQGPEGPTVIAWLAASVCSQAKVL